MVKKSEMKAFIEMRGYVTVHMVTEEFGVTELQACNLIKACWDRGLLAPLPGSWFTLPGEDGGPQPKPPAEEVNRRRLSWYRPELERVRKIWEDDPHAAVTLMDGVEETGITLNRLRKVFNLLVETDELITTQAEYGGAFGRKPLIYSKDLEQVAERNAKLEGEAKARTKARQSKASATREKMRKERKEALVPEQQVVIDRKPRTPLKVDIREEY